MNITYLEDAVQQDLFAVVEQVKAHASTQWLRKAKQVVKVFAQTRITFTTDDVWDCLGDVHTHQPRAMGAIMREAVKDGLAEPTGQYVKTNRPEAHSRPIPVYRAML